MHTVLKVSKLFDARHCGRRAMANIGSLPHPKFASYISPRFPRAVSISSIQRHGISISIPSTDPFLAQRRVVAWSVRRTVEQTDSNTIYNAIYKLAISNAPCKRQCSSSDEKKVEEEKWSNSLNRSDREKKQRVHAIHSTVDNGTSGNDDSQNSKWGKHL